MCTNRVRFVMRKPPRIRSRRGPDRRAVRVTSPRGGSSRGYYRVVHPLTLYVEGYFTNVTDASCYVALTEKQLQFATARALLRDGQGDPLALRDKAAIGRIPALQHGDVWLTESLAIVEYLDDVFPTPRLLPVDPARRARMRQVMTWLRSVLWTLRSERPWQLMVYPVPVAPMSPQAAREAGELVALVEWLAAHGELATWTIARAARSLQAARPPRDRPRRCAAAARAPRRRLPARRPSNRGRAYTRASDALRGCSRRRSARTGGDRRAPWGRRYRAMMTVWGASGICCRRRHSGPSRCCSGTGSSCAGSG